MSICTGSQLLTSTRNESTFTVSNTLEQPLAERQSVEFLAQADFTYELKIDVFNENQFIGGYRRNWTVPWEQLAPAREITFHVASTEGSDDYAFALLNELPQKSALVPEPTIK